MYKISNRLRLVDVQLKKLGCANENKFGQFKIELGDQCENETTSEPYKNQTIIAPFISKVVWNKLAGITLATLTAAMALWGVPGNAAKGFLTYTL